MHLQRTLLARAVTLERLTLGWTIPAGLLGLTFGTLSRSVALTAFGLDGLVEAICAYALLRRVQREIEGLTFSETDERQAARFVGGLLMFAAVYVSADALWNLIIRREPGLSEVGIVLTIMTVPIMIPLANAKLRIARAISSRALWADAIGNAVCWYLAIIVLVSLVARIFYPLWWFDGVASLLVVGLLLFEGVQAWKGASLSP